MCRLLKRERRLECPVISVGNIVCGGTGKTPAVELVAGLLLKKGHKIAVLSRGYMKSGSACLTVVSDGNKLLPAASEGGDEPLMLARNLPGAAVISGRDRYRAGMFAIERFGSSCIVLDDGFQHFSLARDMDIVVIDSTRPFGNGCLLPRGNLREAPPSLKRADLFILTHVNFCDDINGVREMLFKIAGKKPMVETVHAPLGFREINGCEAAPRGAFRGKKAFVFSGIGRHCLFEKSLSGEGVDIRGSFSFPDHYPYTSGDIETVFEKARALGAQYVITTAKDAARIEAGGINPEGKIFTMEMRLEPVNGFEELDKILSACLRNCHEAEEAGV